MALPPGGSTCAEPPPEIMPTSACGPITAILWIFGIERQLRPVIFQQDDALLGKLLSNLEPTLDVDHAFLRGIVDHACGEHGSKNTPDVVVQFRHGELARLDLPLQRVAVENPAWLLLIEAGSRSLGRAVGRAPVGEDESFELPVSFQQIAKQVFVLAGVVAVDAVVGAHHGGGVGFLHADFERQQVALARRAPVDVHVDGVAAALLIVESEMLDVADDALRLHASDDGCDHLAGQDRIFAHVFEGAAAARLAGEVDAAAQRHVVALVAQFAADEGAIVEAGIEVPACGLRDVSGQRGRVAAVLAALAHTVSGVRHLDIGNAQAGNTDYIAGSAVGTNRHRTDEAEILHASAVQQGDFLVEGHLLHHHRGALVRGKVNIHPAMRLSGGLGEAADSQKADRRRSDKQGKGTESALKDLPEHRDFGAGRRIDNVAACREFCLVAEYSATLVTLWASLRCRTHFPALH